MTTRAIVLLVGDSDAGIDAVGMDERRGAYKATRHLIDVGHKRIAIIDGANPQGNREKREGYQQALDEAGIAYDPALVLDPRGQSVDRGYWAIDGAMTGTDRPTAVFAANDSLALGALRWCLKHNVRVPEDIAVVGFHGQTVLHQPERHLTVQLGDGGALAKRLGIPVVHDFRAAEADALAVLADVGGKNLDALGTAMTESRCRFAS